MANNNRKPLSHTVLKHIAVLAENVPMNYGKSSGKTELNIVKFGDNGRALFDVRDWEYDDANNFVSMSKGFRFNVETGKNLTISMVDALEDEAVLKLIDEQRIESTTAKAKAITKNELADIVAQQQQMIAEMKAAMEAQGLVANTPATATPAEEVAA